MKSLLLNILLLALLLPCASQAQIAIDSSFTFQSNSKKYSLFIPSSYDSSTPNKLMLGMHPWNTSRWDAEAWRDTLSVFAENNGLILVCPDGGSDGRVDDNLDYDFTEDLLDSVRTWYSIDEDYQYIMGFSIGGKATYEFGFSHSTEFGGYIPIGAATSEAELSPGISSSLDEAYYLVHGSSDAASTRYNPILNRLQTEGAITNSEFMSGVGHTIDFPNRNQILTEAYVWIDSVNSAQLNSVPIEIQEDKLESTIELLQLNDVLTIKSAFDYQVNTYAIDGKVAELVELGENRYQLPSRTGVYLVSVENKVSKRVFKVYLGN